MLTGSRSALIIGNGDYEPGALRNPANDAQALADALSRLGFRVTLKTDVDLSGMLHAMTRFVRETRNDNVRLFYYAGHALQHRGKNFLVPIDADIQTPHDIPTQAAEVQQLVDHMQRSEFGVNVVILDACRTYPITVQAKPRTRGVAPTGPAAALPSGLAEIVAPRGTVIAFSTAPGAVARDGDALHSVYAKHLLANMEVPGLTVEQLFKRVRDGVLRETQLAQTPWENSSLVGEFCFKAGPRGECPADGRSTPAKEFAKGR
jgi:uncharacterized caspase-like protein